MDLSPGVEIDTPIPCVIKRSDVTLCGSAICDIHDPLLQDFLCPETAIFARPAVAYPPDDHPQVHVAVCVVRCTCSMAARCSARCLS